MVNKILLPQEIEVFYIIPTIRKYIAINLKKQGLKQKDIAAIMMIDTSAISQYASTKRGNKIKINKEVQKEIEKSSKNIKDPFSYIKETQRILRHIRENCLCEIHKQISTIPKGCKSCQA
jgi:predicted transcriptional regulator